MKILFVNNIPFNPSFGGIERVTDILTKAFIARGHQVYYLCNYVDENHKDMLEYNFPAKLYIMPEEGGFFSQKNIKYYESLLKELCVDLIVNQRGLQSWQNATLLSNIKSISVLHSMPNYAIIRACQNLLRKPSSLYEYIKYPLKFLLYPYLSNRIADIIRKELCEQYSFIAENSDAIVLLSNSYKKQFLSYIPGCTSTIVKAIYNPNTYSLQQINPEYKEKVILYVGRLEAHEKCPMRLLKIWEKLFLKHPDWKLMIVGDGSERLAMQSYIEKNGLERVCLLGRKRNLEEFYIKASIVCLTSTYEGWGMALTEGMQFGCIPFTFDNGASTDIIDDGLNGYVIPTYNLKKYARCLSALMFDELKRKKMAQAAYDKSKLFDVENVVCQWEKLCYDILNKKSDN